MTVKTGLALSFLIWGVQAFTIPKKNYAAKFELKSSISEASELMKDVRSQLAENEDANLVMQALRGSNMNDDDSQVQGLQMKLVDVGDGNDSLPLNYDPVALKKFFSKRPLAVMTRILQLTSVGGGLFFKTAFDAVSGRLKKNPDLEVERAAELRDTITSLGPMFIKLGQVRLNMRN